MENKKQEPNKLKDVDYLKVDGYDPEGLLQALSDRFSAKNDAALARALEVQPPIISKIRYKHAPVSALLMVRIHDKTGWSINEIRQHMNVPTA